MALFGEVIAREKTAPLRQNHYHYNKCEFATQYSFLIPWKLIILRLVCPVPPIQRTVREEFAREKAEAALILDISWNNSFCLSSHHARQVYPIFETAINPTARSQQRVHCARDAQVKENSSVEKIGASKSFLLKFMTRSNSAPLLHCVKNIRFLRFNCF